ncbi:uncharacterized protein LOC134834560 [Culicoides brevitarsis]|uniref:uncharacterized protein LOC134834560 n=1 Tax=Culicoides brevitarsis TaxID=469753 RepID=UPI00307C235E
MNNPEVTTNPTMDLMDLNDDCLLYILQFLNLIELMDLRGVCCRLDNLILQSRSRFVHFNFKAFPSGQNFDETKFLEILQFLGSTIKSLDLNGFFDIFPYFYGKSVIFQWISEHCVNLETYIHEDFDFDNIPMIQQFASVVRTLRSLTLINCSFDDSLGDCFIDAQLEELKVDGMKITEKFFKNVSNLISLSIRQCINMTADSHIQVLKNNLKVRKLEISSICKTEELVNFISKLPQIEELTMNVTSVNFSAFGDLPNLKKLKLSQKYYPVLDKDLVSVEMKKLIEQLKQKNIIEDLETRRMDLHEHLNLISELTSLKELSLDKLNRATDADVKNLQKLVNLEKLTIFSFEKKLSVDSLIKSLKRLQHFLVGIDEIDIEYLEKLTQTLNHSQNRPKLELHVETIHVGEQSDVLYDLLRNNKDVLKVSYYDLNYSE